MATTAASRPPSANLHELEVTVVSAKHLKNVNWLYGDLKPYVILWVDPDRRLATKSDDSGSTRPVWNERFMLPLVLTSSESVLTLEIFHSKPSEAPKPLVGTLRVQLKDLVDSDDSTKLRTFQLLRPSGRPQGKIRMKLALRERPMPNSQITPPSTYYYLAAPPRPHLPSTAARDYSGYSPSPYNSHLQPPPAPRPGAPSLPAHRPLAPQPPPPPPPPHSYQHSGYSDQCSSNYFGYYPQQPVQPQPQVPPPSQFYELNGSYSMPGPSAPVDYAPYDQKRGGKLGTAAGLGVGAVAGALGGLTLNDVLKYQGPKKAMDYAESDLETENDYSDYY